MGKSTGTGALSVWTHNLQDMEWVPDYVSSGYNGPAVKAPAGAIGTDLAAFLSPKGYAVVSGECPVSTFPPFCVSCRPQVRITRPSASLEVIYRAAVIRF